MSPNRLPKGSPCGTGGRFTRGNRPSDIISHPLLLDDAGDLKIKLATPLQDDIINKIQENPDAALKHIADLCGCSVSTVNNLIGELRYLYNQSLLTEKSRQYQKEQENRELYGHECDDCNSAGYLYPNEEEEYVCESCNGAGYWLDDSEETQRTISRLIS